MFPMVTCGREIKKLSLCAHFSVDCFLGITNAKRPNCHGHGISSDGNILHQLARNIFLIKHVIVTRAITWTINTTRNGTTSYMDPVNRIDRSTYSRLSVSKHLTEFFEVGHFHVMKVFLHSR